MPLLYLDNNATTRPAPEVANAVNHAQAELWANPSSIHRPGQAAKHKIELARKSLAALLRAKPRDLVLTGSGTEAINLAIRGCLKARGSLGRAASGPPPSVVTTRAEHSAVRECAIDLERSENVRIHWAALDHEGLVDLAALRALLESDPAIALVSIQWANNETGAIQPVHDIGALCRERGILYHCDATQMVGKHETGNRLDAFDLLNFSPHKFHGPKGVGVLYIRPGIRIAPILPGEQELGKRGGTENTPAIIGAGVAADLARAWLTDASAETVGQTSGLSAGAPCGNDRRDVCPTECTNITRARALRDRFESLILAQIQGAVIHGPRDPARRLWNTSSIAFPSIEAEPLLFMLSERGLCASAGAACSSGSLEPSSVLIATGIPPDLANATLRFSLSRFTTPEEIESAAAQVTACVLSLRQSTAPIASP